MSNDGRASAAAERLAALIDATMSALVGARGNNRRLLDFGCGEGSLVDALAVRGYDAHGCDIQSSGPGPWDTSSARLRTIARNPYRLPYEDASFDLVVSTCVLEHAQNTQECFREIHRILVPGGVALHLLPSKWYLPCEPHIYVPLANLFWPRCPRAWFAVWALLGVRNEFQRHLSWREVADLNSEYCREGLCYFPNNTYRRIALEIFGNCDTPNHLYVRHARGRGANLLRRLPFPRLSGWITGTFRMGLLVMRKSS